MLRTALHTGSALALLAMVAASSRAEPPPGGEGTTVRAKSILGAKVSLQGGTGAGTVDDIVLSDQGVVEYLIVSDNGKLVTVPWEAARFNYEQRTATINITQERFRQIPTYTTERYPNFYAPTYRNEVYKHYGLTPGQERRLERRQERRQDRRP